LLHARFVDPANSNNILSDSLNETEKRTVAKAAREALSCSLLLACKEIVDILPTLK
jgi:hypothetical protein